MAQAGAGLAVFCAEAQTVVSNLYWHVHWLGSL